MVRELASSALLRPSSVPSAACASTRLADMDSTVVTASRTRLNTTLAVRISSAAGVFISGGRPSCGSPSNIARMICGREAGAPSRRGGLRAAVDPPAHALRDVGRVALEAVGRARHGAAAPAHGGDVALHALREAALAAERVQPAAADGVVAGKLVEDLIHALRELGHLRIDHREALVSHAEGVLGGKDAADGIAALVGPALLHQRDLVAHLVGDACGPFTAIEHLAQVAIELLAPRLQEGEGLVVSPDRQASVLGETLRQDRLEIGRAHV